MILFHYSLQNQANMLSDTLRTNSYRRAILGNATPSFQNKTVMDVGAGSGVLTFFAVEAGAKKVFAMEASNMASKMQLVSLAWKERSTIGSTPLAARRAV